jgi:hypothetical protein
MTSTFTFKNLLQTLLEHHKRSKDPTGVSIYQEALAQLEVSGTISGGLGDYVWNRIAPSALYPTYYKTIWPKEGRRKVKSEVVEFFRQKPELILLQSQPYHFKEETKVKTKGSIIVFDAWVDELIYQKEVSDLQRLLNSINNNAGMKSLEQQQRIVLLKAIGNYFMDVGSLTETDKWVLAGLKKVYLK